MILKKKKKEKGEEPLVGARLRIAGRGERGVGAEADGVSAEARIFLMGPRWQYADQHYNFAITQEEGLRVVCVREHEHILEKDCEETRKGGKVLQSWEREDRRQQVTCEERRLAKISINKVGFLNYRVDGNTQSEQTRNKFKCTRFVFFFYITHQYLYI